MIINKKRIRTLGAYTKGLEEGQPIVVSVGISDIDSDAAIDIGLSPDFSPGKLSFQELSATSLNSMPKAKKSHKRTNQRKRTIDSKNGLGKSSEVDTTSRKSQKL
ncbi:hypothetical protein [Aliamphritea spongicola]|nr:hypothetical protein [Aliamphritea spongicola]